MASSIIGRFLVDVTSKGLEKAKSGVQSLGNSIRATGDAHTIADRQMREAYSTQAKGVIGTANSTKSFSKLAQTMGSGGSGLVGAYATLAANIFAVTAAFNALQNAAQVQQVERGLIALGNRTGQTLTVFADGLKEITGNAISTEQALRSTAQVVSAGFGREELERLGNVATDVSFALGRNMTDSIDRLTRGVIKLEPELLDELGIMTRIGDATGAYAVSVGKAESSLTRAERSQAFFNAVMAEGELKFGGLSDAAGNTKALNQLGATFSDLTKDILNFINKGALPLAEILNNKGFLLAGMVLFAGTIKSQLLPGLGDLAERSSKAAETLADVSKEQGKTIASLSNGSKAFASLDKALADGTASYKDLENGIKSADRVQRSYETSIERGAVGRNKLTAQSIANMRDEIEYIESRRVVLRNMMATEAQASAQAKQAAAINAASSGGFTGIIQAYKLAALSAKDYALSIQNSAAAAGRTIGIQDKLRISMYKTATAARIAGAAFLNMIPVIGQIILVLTLVWEAFSAIAKAMQTEEQKAYKESLKDLSEIVEGLAEKEEEYLKTLESRAAAYLREIQGLKNVGNSMNELREQMEAVIRAREAMSNRTQVTSAEMSEDIALAALAGEAGHHVAMQRMRERDLANRTQYQVAIDELRENSRGEVRDSEEFEALEAMMTSGIPGAAQNTSEAIRSIIGDLNEFKSLPLEEQYARIASAVVKASSAYQNMSISVTNLENALKNADTAFAQLTTSSINATPYDAATSSIQDLNASYREMYIAIVESNSGLERFGNLLSGISSNVRQYMSANARNIITEFNEQDAIIQRISSITESARTEDEREELATAIERRAVQMSQMHIVQNQLQAVEDMLEAAQTQERLTKRQLDLEKARMNAVSAIYETTAEGLRAQFAAENRILDLQQESINTRINLNNNLISSNNWTPEDDRALAAAQANKEHRRREIDRLTQLRTEEGREFSDHEQQVLNRYLEQERAAARLIERQQQSVNAQTAGVELQLQSDLLAEQRLTAEQETAAVLQRQVNLTVALLERAEEVNKTAQDIRRTEAQIARLAAGRSQLLVEELSDLRQVNSEERRRAQNQYQYDRARLNAETAVTQAILSRGNLTEEERRAAQADLNRQNENLNLLTHELNVRLQNIDTAEMLAVLERVAVDTRGEGLQMQLDALDYLDRYVSAQSELNSELRTQSSLTAQIDRRRRGWVETDESRQIDEIDAAMEAYRFAVMGADLKRTTIELEYALLDAQRQQSMFALQTRRAELASIVGSDNPAVQQLDVTISTLANSANLIEAGRNAALRLVDVSVENARNQLILASTVDRSFESTSQRLAEYNRIQSLRNEGMALANSDVLADKIGTSTAEAIIDNSAIEPIFSASETITSSTDRLVEAINTLVERLTQYLENNRTTSTDVPQYVSGSGQELRDLVAMVMLEAINNPQAQRDVTQVILNRMRMSGSSASDVVRSPYQFEPYTTRRADFERISLSDPAAQAVLANILPVINGTGLNPQLTNATHFAAPDVLRERGQTMPSWTREYNRLYGAHGHDFYDGAFNGAGGRDSDAGITQLRDQIQAPVNQIVGDAVTEAVIRATEIAPTSLAAVETLTVPTLEAANDNLRGAVEVTHALVEKGGDMERASSSLIEQTASFLNLFNIIASTDEYSMLNVFNNMADALGPAGTIVPTILTGIESITQGINRLQTVLDDPKANFGAKFSAYASIAQSALGTIQTLLNASADARIAAIDREIAAEQARDGQSAESVEKIQALERKKDAMARKQFETNKKIMMAQAVISTATAVAQALSATTFFPVNVGLAALAGAMGAAQLAIIAGTSYQSTAAGSSSIANNSASTLSIGKRGESVDVARNNANAGGEIGYLRGQQGYGTNASNYRVVGSAYGGPVPRGYGNAAYLVGEKGPEVITPEVPVNVKPANDNKQVAPISASISISAIDAKGVEEVLRNQRGNIIGMLREAANSTGESFMEDVDVSIYNKPSKVGRL